MNRFPRVSRTTALTLAARLWCSAASTAYGQIAADALPETPAITAQPTAPRFNAAHVNPLGITFRYPAAWHKQVEDNGVAGLVPDDAPQGDAGPREIYILAAAPWPAENESDVHNPDLIARISEEVTNMMPIMSREGEPVFSGSGDQTTVMLRFKGPSPLGFDARANIHASVRKGVLFFMLGVGEAGAITSRESTAKAMFAATEIVTPKIDAGIAGNWSRSSSNSSFNGGFASAYTLELHADGSYTRSSQTVGGTSDASIDSGKSITTGRWTAAAGILTLTSSDGNVITKSYKLVDNNLVLTTNRGREIWSR